MWDNEMNIEMVSKERERERMDRHFIKPWQFPQLYV
jgi:hypothetical protein